MLNYNTIIIYLQAGTANEHRTMLRVSPGI